MFGLMNVLNCFNTCFDVPCLVSVCIAYYLLLLVIARFLAWCSALDHYKGRWTFLAVHVLQKVLHRQPCTGDDECI